MKIKKMKLEELLNSKYLDQLIELYLFNRTSDTLTKEEFFTPDEDYSITDINKLYNKKKDNYLNGLNSSKNDSVILLFKNYNLIGSLFLEDNNFIYDVIIKKEERSMGYSKLLLNYLIEDMKIDKLSLYVKKDNVVAISLYKKYNFKVVEKIENDNLLMKN